MKRSLTLLLGLSLGLAVVWAQQSPSPGAAPEKPSTEQITPKPSTEEGGNLQSIDPNKVRYTATETMTYADITVLEVAKLYEEASGMRVIMRSKDAKSEIGFSIKGPLTNADISKFLKNALLTEGFAMIPIPDEPDIVRLVSVAKVFPLKEAPGELNPDATNPKSK